MSKLDATNDFPGHASGSAAKKLAHIKEYESKQAVAATLASDVLFVADFDGQLAELLLIAMTNPGAGESMVYDVLKNGSTALSGTHTLDNPDSTAKPIDLYSLLTAAGKGFVEGDVYTVARTYVAGGTPAPIGPNVVKCRAIPRGVSVDEVRK